MTSVHSVSVLVLHALLGQLGSSNPPRSPLCRRRGRLVRKPATRRVVAPWLISKSGTGESAARLF